MPGTAKLTRLEENIGAADVELSRTAGEIDGSLSTSGTIALGTDEE
jgi:hypothetical protein